MQRNIWINWIKFPGRIQDFLLGGSADPGWAEDTELRNGPFSVTMVETKDSDSYPGRRDFYSKDFHPSCNTKCYF